ncbi:MAG: hypothetical protein GKC04_06550 [Methanomicrobiales archaeon]|nr:hypothetical protein [Methanomicrobiales archaeon]
METCEIHVNRRGINSIEVPPQVEVEAGFPLLVRIINDGTPVHLTLSTSNAGMFTDFYHENLYVRDVLEFRIPTKEDAYAGFFDVEAITGYGTRKASFRVFVKKYIQKEPPPEEEVHEVVPRVHRPAIPWLLLLLVIMGITAYGGWVLTGQPLLAHMAILVLLAGVWLGWHTER